MPTALTVCVMWQLTLNSNMESLSVSFVLSFIIKHIQLVSTTWRRYILNTGIQINSKSSRLLAMKNGLIFASLIVLNCIKSQSNTRMWLRNGTKKISGIRLMDCLFTVRSHFLPSTRNNHLITWIEILKQQEKESESFSMTFSND